MELSKTPLAVLVFWILVFTFQPSFAQKNYLPGYIVDLKGDTVEGLVDYRNWTRSPEKVRFRKSPDSHMRTFEPLDIKGFYVNGEVYVSAIVDAEKSPVALSELDFSPEIRIRKGDTTFLQAIVLGPKSLYYYTDRNGKDQFYIDHGSTFELLVYKKYLKRHGANKTIGETNPFRSQASSYLQDCSSIHLSVGSTYLDKKSLQKLFVTYYDCIAGESTYQAALEKFTTEIGVLAGVSQTKLTFPGEEYVYMANASYPVSTNAAAGLYLDLVFPGMQQKLSLNNELIYTSYKVKGEYFDIRSADIQDLYFTEIGFSYVKLNNLLRYKYPVGRVHLFANAGVSNGFAINQTSYLRIESKVYSNETVTEKEAGDDPFRKHELGLLLGGGVKIKRFSLEYRYERGNGISDYVPSQTKRHYLLLGYRL